MEPYTKNRMEPFTVEKSGRTKRMPAGQWASGKDTEAATQRCSEEKVFWKYAVNLQENTHALA